MRSVRPTILLIALWLAAAETSRAGDEPAKVTEAPETWSVHAQATGIEQWHGPFTSPYQGLNSLDPQHEDQHTFTATAFLGRSLWPGAELYYNPEVSQGTGLSGTVGAAGFPNGEATRAGGRNPEYNTARLFLRETIGLGGQTEHVDSDQNQLAGVHDIERITITVGKLSAADQFDSNRYSHDPRTQFLNWALMDDGAWDYPADTKGYTGGLTVEWNTASAAIRWGGFLEPKAANGRALEHDPARALGQVVEGEWRYSVGAHAGAVRPMVDWNRAHMGSYAEAAALPVPDVTLTRSYRAKVGAGVSWDQEIADQIGIFARAGLNDGRTESWAFTEVDRTLSAGLSVGGARWHRASDTLGIAALANGLSSEHRRYLAAGGYGFIVGDGRLRYGSEQILESYYSCQVFRWFSLAADWQLFANPGYNRDRGPVSIFAIRGHLQR